MRKQTLLVIPILATILGVQACYDQQRTVHAQEWRDLAQQEIRSYLSAHGVIARDVIANNAGGIELDLRGADITDIELLSGMPLEVLLLSGTRVEDVTPLQESRFLWKLDISSTLVTDLTPLHTLHLRSLDFSNCRVSDIDSLRGMQLQVLSFAQTDVTNLAPLLTMPLEEVYFSPERFDLNQLDVLRRIPQLRCINYFSHTEDFWRELGIGLHQNEQGRRSVP